MTIDRVSRSVPLTPIVAPSAERSARSVNTPNRSAQSTSTVLGSSRDVDLSQLREHQFQHAQENVAKPALKQLGSRMLQMWRLLPNIENPESLSTFNQLGQSLAKVIGRAKFDGDTIIAQDLTLKLNPNRSFTFTAGSIAALPPDQAYTATLSIKGMEPTQLAFSHDDGWQSQVVHQSDSHPLRASIDQQGSLSVKLTREELLIAQGVVNLKVSNADTSAPIHQEITALRAAQHPILSLNYDNTAAVQKAEMGPIVQDGLRTVKSQLQQLSTLRAEDVEAAPAMSREEALQVSQRVRQQLGSGYSGIYSGLTVLDGLSERLLNVLRS